jgi:hypothetical protein
LIIVSKAAKKQNSQTESTTNYFPLLRRDGEAQQHGVAMLGIEQ